LFALGLLLSAGAIAAEFSGYIIDEKCASKPAMKGSEACAPGAFPDRPGACSGGLYSFRLSTVMPSPSVLPMTVTTWP
jgi:hypothetical protein